MFAVILCCVLTIDIINLHKLKFKRRENQHCNILICIKLPVALFFNQSWWSLIARADRSGISRLPGLQMNSVYVCVFFLLLSPMRGFVRSRLHFPRFVRRARWIDLSMARFSLVLWSRVLFSLVILCASVRVTIVHVMLAYYQSNF